MIQASGQASWTDLVWVEMSKHMEGQNITSNSHVNLDMEWGCSFTADACGQFYCGVCFVAPWGTDIINHYLFRMGVSCTSTVNYMGKQFITWGCFFGADLYDVSSLSLLLVSVMGGLHSSIRFSSVFAHGTRAVVLSMPVASLGTAIVGGILCRTVVMAVTEQKCWLVVLIVLWSCSRQLRFFHYSGAVTTRAGFWLLYFY